VFFIGHLVVLPVQDIFLKLQVTLQNAQFLNHITVPVTVFYE